MEQHGFPSSVFVLKWKTNIAFLVCCLFYISLIQHIYSKEVPVVTSQPFILILNDGESLGLGSYGANVILINITGGLLNSSSSTLLIYAKQGSLNFNSENSCNFTINAPYTYDWQCWVHGAKTLSKKTGYYDVEALANTPTKISWQFFIESFVGKYTMLGIGLGGVVLMCFSPIWVAWQIKKKGVDANTVERCGYALLLFIVGLGLIIMWLWG